MILKGVLLYTTCIAILVSIFSIETLFNSYNYLIILLDIGLVYLCKLTISEQEFIKLLGYRN
jgi:hypothetical protein